LLIIAKVPAIGFHTFGISMFKGDCLSAIRTTKVLWWYSNVSEGNVPQYWIIISITSKKSILW